MQRYVQTATLDGITAHGAVIGIETILGCAGIEIPGEHEQTRNETVKRVSLAIEDAGYKLPRNRIRIELRPQTALRTELHALPIALGILALREQIRQESLAEKIIIGGLAHGGAISPIRGMYPIAALAADEGAVLVGPWTNKSEAAATGTVNAILSSSFQDIARKLDDGEEPKLLSPPGYGWIPNRRLERIAGCYQAKWIAQIAAAGGHHTVIGAAGRNERSSVARAVSELMGPLEELEKRVWLSSMSTRGLLNGNPREWDNRPFRAVQTTASAWDVSGTRQPRGPESEAPGDFMPGEAALAHGGVLFIENLGAYDPGTLTEIVDAARTGWTGIDGRGTPSRFVLVAGVDERRTGPVEAIRGAMPRNRQLETIFDLQAWADKDDCSTADSNEQPTTGQTRRRIEIAHERQNNRYRRGKRNATVNEERLRSLAQLTRSAKTLLRRATDTGDPADELRVLRVARTIADLKDNETVTELSIQAALTTQTGAT